MPEAGRFEGTSAAVTGAAGFIGAAVCRALAAEGAGVTGVDREGAGRATVEAAGARFEAADVTDRPALIAALGDARLIVHTAARVDDGGDMAEFVRVNVGGTANVLEAADRSGARVVHLSSVAVFGYDEPAEQEDDAEPRECGIPYLDTKSRSDVLARSRGAVVVRPGDVYGPGSVPWVLRPVDLARTRRLAYPSETAMMLPVFIDDLVEAILLAASSGRSGRAYTAWHGEPVAFAEYFRRLAAVAGAPPPRRVPAPLLRALGRAAEAVDRARGRTPRFTARAVTFVNRRGLVSNRRAREELGWEPRVGLDEGLRRVGESL